MINNFNDFFQAKHIKHFKHIPTCEICVLGDYVMKKSITMDFILLISVIYC